MKPATSPHKPVVVSDKKFRRRQASPARGCDERGALYRKRDALYEDIQPFSRMGSDDDELIGERLRSLAKILNDMG